MGREGERDEDLSRAREEMRKMEQQAYQLISIGILLVVVVIALTLGRK